MDNPKSAMILPRFSIIENVGPDLDSSAEK